MHWGTNLELIVGPDIGLAVALTELECSHRMGAPARIYSGVS